MIAVALSTAAIVSAPASSLGQTLAADPLQAQIVALDPVLTQPKSDPVIAKVDNVEIRQSDLALAEEFLSRGQPREEEAKRENLLHFLTDMVIMSNAAQKRNVADEADMQRIQHRVEFARKKALMDTLLQKTASAAITDEAVRAAYREVVSKNPAETELRLRSIVFLFKDEAGAKAAEGKAKAAYERIAHGEDFIAVAGETSESPAGKQNGGDLGYLTRATMGQEFADAAFALNSGGVSHPVKTQFGWFILKVEDKRTREPISFEAVRDKLETMIARKAELQLISDLRSEAKIEILDTPGTQAPTEAAK